MLGCLGKRVYQGCRDGCRCIQFTTSTSYASPRSLQALQVVNRAALPVSRATKRFVLAEHCLQLASSPSVKSKCVPVAITFRDIDSQEHLDKLDRRRREGVVYLDPIDPTACETVSVSAQALDFGQVPSTGVYCIHIP